jgi:hypothetical protein
MANKGNFAMTDRKYPEMYDVLNRFINAQLSSVFTALPGEIISFDGNKKICSVQPLIKKKYKNGDVVNLPLLDEVPVLYPQTSKCIISFPLTKGDQVLLIFAQRSLDEWKNKQGIVENADNRKFDINDAIAIPGLYSKNTGLEVDLEALLIQNATLKLKIFEDGKLQIENSSSELINAINNLCTELKNFAQEVSNITTNTQLGPQPPINQAALVSFVSSFNSILSDLTSFKK